MWMRIAVYGLICGAVIIGVNTLSLELGMGEVWLGLAVMVLAFSAIYVAVKRHRDEQLGGVITFRLALLVGLGIALVASVVYVLLWEAYLAGTDYGYIQDYVDGILRAAREDGASPEHLLDLHAQTDEMMALYENPVTRLPMTFVEVFPVGLLMALGSALILRNHQR